MGVFEVLSELVSGLPQQWFSHLKAFSDEFFGHPKVAIAGIQTVFEGFKTNNQDAVRELQLRYDLPITMGHDPGDGETHQVSSTMRNYRTGGTPWLILINPDGVVVFNGFHVDTSKLIDYVGAQIAQQCGLLVCQKLYSNFSNKEKIYNEKT